MEVLDSIIKRDETNAAPRKRRVAILKAQGRVPEAIRELTEYLRRLLLHILCIFEKLQMILRNFIKQFIIFYF
jgi:septum formation topological specificity factor MinE